MAREVCSVLGSWRTRLGRPRSCAELEAKRWEDDEGIFGEESASIHFIAPGFLFTSFHMEKFVGLKLWLGRLIEGCMNVRQLFRACM